MARAASKAPAPPRAFDLSQVRNRIIGHIELLPSEIQDHPGQAWDHPDYQARALDGILHEVGITDDLLIYRSERAGGAWVSIDGHLRKSLDPNKPWPCRILDVTDSESDYLIATHDQVGMMKKVNAEALDALLSEVSSANHDVQQMFTDMAQAAGLYIDDPNSEQDAEPQVDKLAELNGQWGVQAGDVWQIGPHRLLCGDATNAADYLRLLGSEMAEIVITSPPYNVAAKSSLPNKDKYANATDALAEIEYLQLLNAFTELALRHAAYVFVNVQSVAGNKVALIDYLYAWRARYADTLIWDKTIGEPAMAKNVLNSRYEYVHVFSQPAIRTLGCKEFRGTLDNILTLSSRQDKDRGVSHKASYPVAFARFFVDHFTNPQAVVLDPFGGTGTTLVACEQAGRVGRMLELDPGYCAVILQRCVDAFGAKPVRVVN